jgi:hypothetical protein
VARTLKISMETGRVGVADLPGDEASSEAKDAFAGALIAEVEQDLAEVEKRLEENPRQALLDIWVLHTTLEGCPARWLQNFAKRRERNDLMTRIGGAREQASDLLEEGVGKSVWEDLPYIRDALGLLFDKLRASGEVQRMILTPLGSLNHAEIRYQREGPEDLARVCQELTDHMRKTLSLDDEVAKWGNGNRHALLHAQPPAEIPEGMVGGTGGAMGALVAGLALLGAGGASLAGAIPVPAAGGIGMLVLGLGLAGVGGTLFSKVGKQRAQVPQDFASLSDRFRERLYVVCSLRNLFQASSRYQRADDAFTSFIKENGGKARWKRVKSEARDLTEVFATETWNKGTVEGWLKDKVTKVFRLDSTTLSAPGDIDDDTWDVIFQAYLLESVDDGGDQQEGKLLAAVGDLLFTKRGEDVQAERERVFAQVRAAWDKAVADGHQL